MKQPIYGYMRAYASTPDEQIRRDEARMFRWARAAGYDLAGVHKETEAGSIRELTAMVEELERTGTRAVVVPSFEHFGVSRVLENLREYVVRDAGAGVPEAAARDVADDEKPVIYGYIRVHGQEGDEAVRQAEQMLRDYAGAGYELVLVHHEVDAGGGRPLDELIEELRRVEADAVVVPSLDHLASSPTLQGVLIDHIGQATKSGVIELDGGQ